MAGRKSGRRSSEDLLQNVKFVKLVAVQDLPRAEMIREILRRSRIAAVIINDEKVQARGDRERAEARPEGAAFRIEVPESLAAAARAVLGDLEKSEEP